MLMYRSLQQKLPNFVRRHVLYFEAAIEHAVTSFARTVPVGGRVLDAGAGEAKHATSFRNMRYVAVDLAVGDSQWDYSKLDAIADLAALPFSASCFDACLNIVTLEHVPEPESVLKEIERTLKPGGYVLLIVPLEWELHQAPNDYFRYTCYGLQYLLRRACFSNVKIQPLGGYFRLLARRLLNGLQFFRGIWFLLAAIVLVPLALVLPFFDGLDRNRIFTLGYICTAQKGK